MQRMHVYRHMYIYTHMHVCMYICVSIHVYVCIYIHMYTQLYTYKSVPAYIYIYTYIYIYVRVFACMYITYTYICMSIRLPQSAYYISLAYQAQRLSTWVMHTEGELYMDICRYLYVSTNLYACVNKPVHGNVYICYIQPYTKTYILLCKYCYKYVYICTYLHM